MNTGIKILVGTLLLGVMSIGMVVMYGFGVRSTLNTMEKNVVYQYEQNKNNYDKMWKTFKEAAQVNDMYVQDIEKVFKSAIQSRYANSTNVVFQMVKESNPNFDASLYKRLQEIIEGGRADFEENQKLLLDKKKQYDTILNNYPEKFVADFFGYPKIKLADYGIVTSEKTDGTFKSGKDDEIKLR